MSHCCKDLGSANLTERASFDLRYNGAVKAAQREAANRHLSMRAWKGAGHAAEGSAGLTSNRADVPQGTVPTDYSNYPGAGELCITRAPAPGAAGSPGGSHVAGVGEVLSLPVGARAVNRVGSCGKRRADGMASREM